MYKQRYIKGQLVGECILVDILPSINYGSTGRNAGYGLFLCPLCNNEFKAIITNVKSLVTRSCGCLAKQVAHDVNTKHGLTRTKEYRAWLAIKTRCYNEKDKSYNNYGGRGIRMYDGWLNSFDNFFQHIGLAPSPKHSVDRIDVNGNYEPNNVRWATTKEQASNKRINVIIEYNGRRQTLMQWSNEISKPFGALSRRLKRGWSVEDTFNKPVAYNHITLKKK